MFPRLYHLVTLPIEKFTTTPLPDFINGKLLVTTDCLSEITDFLYKTLIPFQHKYLPKDLKMKGFCKTLQLYLIMAKASTDALLSSNPEVITLESCVKEYYAVLESFEEIQTYIKNNSSFS